MKKILSFLLILLALIVLASCTNDISDPYEDAEDSWENVFKEYWETMSLEYVHFSEESGLDWDAVYDEYLPKFQKLNFEDVKDTVTAFKYFKEMSWQLSDYHYSLTISDNFGNIIQISPSTLQKMKKDHPDWDINDYPDIKSIKESPKSISYTSVNRGLDNPYFTLGEDATPTIEDIMQVYKYMDVVEGATEVSALSKTGLFHNGTADFGTNCIGFTIAKATTADNHPTLTEGEKAWNTVVDTLSLDGFEYFYGLTTEGNIFYFYISQFTYPYCLEPLLYQENLTAAERKTLQDSGLEMAHDILWAQNIAITDSADLKDYKDYIEGKRAELEGIVNLFTQLRNIGASGKCTFDGYTFETVKGVVMDVRSNPGGVTDFLFRLMGSFFYEETKLGSVRYKDSYSRTSYTPWIDFYLEQSYCNPVASQNYSGPFVVIANGSSVSCAEMACMIAKHLPNSKIVGSQTYGGTCALSDRTIFQSGPFEKTHVSIYTTTYQSVDSNGVSLEGVGVTPDVAVDIKAGEDARYKKAIETVKSMAN